MDEATLSELLKLTVARLSAVEANQEIILKTLATFAGNVSGQPWQPIFEDLRAQAKEASSIYQRRLLDELAVLRAKRGPSQKN